MKNKRLYVILLIVIIAAASAAFFVHHLPSQERSPNKQITPVTSQLKSMTIDEGAAAWKNTKNAVLLDVRTADEFSQGHIPGSTNIAIQEIETVESTIAKDTPVFVYCRSGKRSRMASNYLIEHGFSDVTDIGGIVNYTGKKEQGAGK